MDNLPVSDSRTDIVSSNDKSLTDDASIMSADKEHASDAILSADSIHTIDNKTSTAAFRGSGTLLAEKGQFADNGTLKGEIHFVENVPCSILSTFDVMKSSTLSDKTVEPDAVLSVASDYDVGSATRPTDKPSFTDFEEHQLCHVNSEEMDIQIVDYIKDQKKNNSEITHEDELQLTINFCKAKIRSNMEKDLIKIPKKELRHLMNKVIECSLELDRLREESNDPAKRAKWKNILISNGHILALQAISGRNPYCEVCLTTIWRVLQRYRRCEECGMRLHEKCIDGIMRRCVATKLHHSSFEICLDICMEQKLSDQDYKCAECRIPLKFGSTSVEEPRLCDYNGFYYCTRCHWNDQCIIPARIVHNWDFQKYKVCRASKQLLVLIERRPIFDIVKLNPSLPKFVDKLNRIDKLRKNIIFMKCYFICCKNARKLRILQYLNHRQHFVDNSNLYSLSDLRDLMEDRLIPEIEQIFTVFFNHITKECEICQGNGFFCEICSDEKKQQMSIESIPRELRNLRACLLCSMVKSVEQFEMDGCDNCERYLGMKGDEEKVSECTSSNFDGLIAAMIPDESWVCKWQKINRKARGIYAVSVSGTLPSHIVQDLKSQNIRYKPHMRDMTKNS
ncbi:unnamed protein product [Dracunculus medinensis]|uniref:Transcription elongation factor SPT4 n=1 Tax=Dracunculus medinensis TaxID=318479 RepID=A0A0N4UGN7_DRAME|nr:unnamed protein product [Dracunculus medinensis]